MNHPEAREKLLDLAYGELAPGQARALEEHLSGCPGCRAELAALAETRGTMARLGSEPEPGGVGILMAAARQAAEDGVLRKPLLPWVRWATGAAAVMIAGGLAWELAALRRSGAGPADDRVVFTMEAPASLPPPGAPATTASEDKASRPARVAKPMAKAERADAGSGAAAPAFAAAPPPAADLATPVPARAREAAAEKLAIAPAAEPVAAGGMHPPTDEEPPSRRLESSRPAAAKRAAPSAASDQAASAAPRAGLAGRVASAEESADALVLELRRLLDDGTLHEARRRPDPCPGADALRVAWLDGWGKARRLARTAPLPVGEGEATRDQYYDEGGRLRLVVIDGRGPDGRFRRRILLDGSGRRVAEDPAGAPWPEADLVLAEPAAAFWAPSRCAPR